MKNLQSSKRKIRNYLLPYQFYGVLLYKDILHIGILPVAAVLVAPSVSVPGDYETRLPKFWDIGRFNMKIDFLKGVLSWKWKSKKFLS